MRGRAALFVATTACGAFGLSQPEDRTDKAGGCDLLLGFFFATTPLHSGAAVIDFDDVLVAVTGG
jgi:hypothetical protein